MFPANAPSLLFYLRYLAGTAGPLTGWMYLSCRLLMNRNSDRIEFAALCPLAGLALMLSLGSSVPGPNASPLPGPLHHGTAPVPQALPPAVDHSTTIHFPPLGKQQIGDCTCWSSAYYYNTYTQAFDERLDASTGDPDVVCSPRFLFSLISMGHSGAECTRYAMERLGDVGCAPVSEYSMSAHWKQWPGEEARIAALKNRPYALQTVRADTVKGLRRIKQHIANGGCAVTRALFTSNYPAYGANAAGPGIDNGVMYSKEGFNYLRHSLCICGYDNERTYVDHRDGKTYRGAFLIANSEGPNWGSHNSTGTGSKGFLWVAYNMFLEGTFGLYDNDDNPHTDPCYCNPLHPEVYFYDDRPGYRPRLYAVVGVNHRKRNLLTVTGGIGPVQAPAFLGPQVVEPTRHGELAIKDGKRVVIDLTDGIGLFEPGKRYPVFVTLEVNGSATSHASMTSAEFFFDPEGDGTFTTYLSSDPTVVVAPGQQGHAMVHVVNP